MYLATLPCHIISPLLTYRRIILEAKNPEYSLVLPDLRIDSFVVVQLYILHVASLIDSNGGVKTVASNLRQTLASVCQENKTPRRSLAGLLSVVSIGFSRKVTASYSNNIVP